MSFGIIKKLLEQHRGGANLPSYTYDPATQTYQQVSGPGMKAGGKAKSASFRADGIAQRGKTKGKIY